MVSQGIGFACAFVAVAFFGSNFVPVKKFETGDGVFFQFILCTAIWVVGNIVNAVQVREEERRRRGGRGGRGRREDFKKKEGCVCVRVQCVYLEGRGDEGEERNQPCSVCVTLYVVGMPY